MKAILITSVMVFMCELLVAQDPRSLRHATTDSGSADFYVQLTGEKIKFADTLYYFWFKSQALHVSQGFASGNLLEGPFTEYYISGQLKSRGQFEEGLQTGEWKNWYESGQLQSIVNYENGLPHGNFFRYSVEGKIIESGSYRDGHFHGEIISNGTTTDYKNGSVKEKTKKDNAESDTKEKRFQLFKKENSEEREKGKWKSIFQRKEKDEKVKPEKQPEEKSKPENNTVVEKREKRKKQQQGE